MKKFFTVCLGTLLCLGAISCKSSVFERTPEEQKAHEIREKVSLGAKVVRGTAMRKKDLPGKSVFLESVSSPEKEFDPVLAESLAKALTADGYQVVKDKKQASFLLKYNYKSQLSARHMVTTVDADAVLPDDKTVLWQGSFQVTSKPRSCEQYLPGLAVACVAYLGRTEGAVSNNLIKHHYNLLTAVYE